MKRIIASVALIAGLSTATQVFAERDLETGVFLSRDPAGFVDGPNVYAYCTQNPWSHFDPKGLDKVVISGGVKKEPKAPVGGQPDDHDNNWRNFVTSAQRELSEKAKTLPKGEKLEWNVQKSAYEDRAIADKKKSDAYLKEIEGVAKKYGAELRFYETAKDLAQNVNKKSDGSLRTGDQKITEFSFYGHGNPGELWLKSGGAEIITTQDMRSGIFDKNAFAPGATATSWSCNSAAQKNGDNVLNAFHSSTGVPMKGVYGRMDFGPTAVSTAENVTTWFSSPYEAASRTPKPGTINASGAPSVWHNSTPTPTPP